MRAYSHDNPIFSGRKGAIAAEYLQNVRGAELLMKSARKTGGIRNKAEARTFATMAEAVSDWILAELQRPPCPHCHETGLVEHKGRTERCPCHNIRTRFKRQ